jgi:hypothetical protein
VTDVAQESLNQIVKYAVMVIGTLSTVVGFLFKMMMDKQNASELVTSLALEECRIKHEKEKEDKQDMHIRLVTVESKIDAHNEFRQEFAEKVDDIHDLSSQTLELLRPNKG